MILLMQIKPVRSRNPATEPFAKPSGGRGLRFDAWSWCLAFRRYGVKRAIARKVSLQGNLCIPVFIHALDQATMRMTLLWGSSAPYNNCLA